MRIGGAHTLCVSQMLKVIIQGTVERTSGTAGPEVSVEMIKYQE